MIARNSLWKWDFFSLPIKIRFEQGRDGAFEEGSSVRDCVRFLETWLSQSTSQLFVIQMHSHTPHFRVFK